MGAEILAFGNVLPMVLQFLHPGWWIVHIVAIPVVFFIGFALGKKGAAKPPAQ